MFNIMLIFSKEIHARFRQAHLRCDFVQRQTVVEVPCAHLSVTKIMVLDPFGVATDKWLILLRRSMCATLVDGDGPPQSLSETLVQGR